MSTPGFGAPREILPIAPWTSTQIFVERYYTLSEAQIARRAGLPPAVVHLQPRGPAQRPGQIRDHRARSSSLRRRLEAAFGHAPVEQLGYAAAIHVQLLPGPVR